MYVTVHVYYVQYVGGSFYVYFYLYYYYIYIILIILYKMKRCVHSCNGGRTTKTRHAGKQGVTLSPLLSEEVPYQITLIGLSQGSLDRRREKVIWEMFSENDCNTFAD